MKKLHEKTQSPVHSKSGIANCSPTLNFSNNKNLTGNKSKRKTENSLRNIINEKMLKAKNSKDEGKIC